MLVHELGHFIVAKLNKIRVDEFALGMGPKLFGYKHGETEYMLKAFPIGGYVKILGEEDDGEDEKVSKDPRNYKNKPKRVKFAVMIAGVTMNLLLAVVLFYISLARSDFQIALPTDYQTFKPWFATVSFDKVGDFKYSSLVDGAPAQKSGMPSSGVIKLVDGNNVEVSKDLVSYLQVAKEKTVAINVCNENSEDCKDYYVTVSSAGTIGISYTPNYFVNLKYESVAKIFGGFAYAADQLKLMAYYLDTAFATAAQTGNYETVAANTASSPIALYFIVDKIRQYGPMALLDILASMSFSLAVINLLPIPALDGGRIMLLGIEAIIRRPLNKKVENTIIAVSFYLLMALMLIIVLKDIVLIDVLKNMF